MPAAWILCNVHFLPRNTQWIFPRTTVVLLNVFDTSWSSNVTRFWITYSYVFASLWEELVGGWLPLELVYWSRKTECSELRSGPSETTPWFPKLQYRVCITSVTPWQYFVTIMREVSRAASLMDTHIRGRERGHHQSPKVEYLRSNMKGVSTPVKTVCHFQTCRTKSQATFFLLVVVVLTSACSLASSTQSQVWMLLPYSAWIF